MTRSSSLFTRRQTLSAVGIGIAGLGLSGSAGAPDHQVHFVAAPTNDGIDPAPETNAAGEISLSIDTETGGSSYQIYMDCLRWATRYTLEVDGEVISEQPFEGPVTQGLVREQVVAEGEPTGEMVAGGDEASSPEELFKAFKAGLVTLTIHTERYPDGEIAGQFVPAEDQETEA
jgi:hypothetical protein